MLHSLKSEMDKQLDAILLIGTEPSGHSNEGWVVADNNPIAFSDKSLRNHNDMSTALKHTLSNLQEKTIPDLVNHAQMRYLFQQFIPTIDKQLERQLGQVSKYLSL